MTTPSALARSADYGRAVTRPLARPIEIVQRCVLRLDEQGAEASAATAVVVRMTSAGILPATPPFVFRADRPFRLMLVEIGSGAPLMLGFVDAPAT